MRSNFITTGMVIGTTLWLMAGAWLRANAADESLAARRERLERLPPSQANELLEKKRRFDELQPEQQDQLRRLHDQVAHDEQAERLQQVLARYVDWLKTLPSGQRAELLSLPADERIAKIKELMEDERMQQFRRFAEQPPPEEDMKAIVQWFGEFFERNRERILAEMPVARREAIEKIKGAKLEPVALYFRYLRERVPDANTRIVPSDEEIKDLESKLSDATKKILEQSPASQKKFTLLRWIGMAMFNKAAGKISEEELSRFYKDDLAPKEREHLDNLPAEAARRELRQIYFRHQWKKGGDDGRPPFSGRPFPGPFGEGPRPPREGERRPEPPKP